MLLKSYCASDIHRRKPKKNTDKSKEEITSHPSSQYLVITLLLFLIHAFHSDLHTFSRRYFTYIITLLLFLMHTFTFLVHLQMSAFFFFFNDMAHTPRDLLFPQNVFPSGDMQSDPGPALSLL